MSTQTLAFFENKTDEQIIDWMLTNLSEEQIKMCLNTSGIPDTSGLTEPMPPSQPATPDQSLLPQRPSEIVPRPQTTPRQDVKTKILTNFRTKCPNNVIIVEKLEGRIVYFYQFKEVTQEDLRLNRQLNQYIGIYRWVFRTQDRDNMTQLCRDAKLDEQDDIAENPEAYNNPPPIVEQIANEYVEAGLPYPLPFGGPAVEEPAFVSTSSIIVYDPRIQEARNIQIGSSRKINQELYPNIFRRGIRTFPIIIYKIQENNLHYYALSIKDGNVTLEEKSTPVGPGYNTIFRREARNLENSIDSRIPDDADLIKIAVDLVDKLPENEKDAIKEVYTITSTDRFSFFGNDYDGVDGEVLDTLDSEETGKEELYIGSQADPMLVDAMPESFDFEDGSSQGSYVDVKDEMTCAECHTDEELKAYKGKVSDLHCARCIEKRDLLLKGPKSLSHTHYAVITVREDCNGKTKTKTVQWHPITNNSTRIGLPSGIGENDLLF